MSFEQFANSILQNMPGVKRKVKSAYQHVMCALSSQEKTTGDIFRISPDDEYEYMCGYYDKSPWSQNEKWFLLLRVKNTTTSPASMEAGQICLMNCLNGEIEIIAETNCWNTQQGCMLQWLGPDFNEKLIYNDCRDGKYCAVVFDIRSREERVYSLPVYDVSHNGKFGFSLDFSRLNTLRPGYGYANLPDATSGIMQPEGACLWRISLETGSSEPILEYSDLIALDFDKSMEGAFHKINHIMINPGDDRVMLIHRWLKGGKKRSRLLTVNCDGTELFNLSDDSFVSHCYWKDSSHIISFLNRQNTGRHYYIITDRTNDFSMIWPDIDYDGHPSYSPDGKRIVTDSYPDRTRHQKVIVGNEAEHFQLASLYSPFKYDEDVRCDLHPKWDREGKQICVDATVDGKRAVYGIKIAPNDIPASSVVDVNPLVSVIMPTYKRKDCVERAVRSVLDQTYRKIEICLVNDNEPNDEYTCYLEKMVKSLEDPRVRFIVPEHHKNGAAARNVGILAAKGELIAFLDDDDFWLSRKLEDQVNVLSSLDESWGGVSCGRIYVKDNQITRVSLPYESGNIYKQILNREMEIFTGSLLVRKSALINSGLFDESLSRHQDLQFLSCFTKRYSLMLVPSHYLCIDSSDSGNRPNARRFMQVKNEFYSSVNELLEEFTGKELKTFYGIHQGEVLFAAIKERNIAVAIKMTSRLILNPSACLRIAKRAKKRRSEQRMCNAILEQESLNEVKKCLQM